MDMFGKYAIPIMVLLLVMGFIPLYAGSEAVDPPITGVLRVGEGYEYSTIQYAVDEASTGDTIEIHGGTYNESVRIEGFTLKDDNSTEYALKIVGYDFPVISYKGLGNTFYVDSEKVRVQDLKMIGSGNDDTIRMITSRSELVNITVDGGGPTFGHSGIKVVGDDNQITNCQVFNSGSGFDLGSISVISKGNRVVQSKAYNNTESGFRSYNTRDTLFFYCESTHNLHGFEVEDSFADIRLAYSGNNMECGELFENSTVTDSDSGNENNTVGVYSNNSKIILGWMIIRNNSAYGLHLKNYKLLNVRFSDIRFNGGDGIFIDGGYLNSSFELTFNLLFGNYRNGVKVLGPTDRSYVYRNDFISNGEGQAYSDVGCYWYNETSKSGNYWSEHTNPDSNGDGVVDLPYTIPGNQTLNKDIYPAVERNTPFRIPKTIPVNGSAPLEINDISPNATVGEEYHWELTANDPDTNNTGDFTWSIFTEADWLHLNGNILSGIPTKAGWVQIRITVSDGKNTVSTNFWINVERAPNNAPIIGDRQIPSRLKVGSEYSIEFAATDADGDPLLWAMVSDADFLTLEGSILSGIPTEDDIGNYTVNISVTDGIDFDYLSYSLEVFKESTWLKDPIRMKISYENGKPIFSLEDISGGKLTVRKMEWFVDGAYRGNDTSFNGSYLLGNHTVKLRVTDLSGNVYEVTKVMDFGKKAADKEPIHTGYIVLGIMILLVAMISASLFVYRAVSRKQKEDIWEGGTIPVRSSSVRTGRIGGAREGPGEDLDLNCDIVIDEAFETMEMRRMSSHEE